MAQFTETEIKRIELLVHPDASLAWTSDPVITGLQKFRRRNWLERAKEVAKTPDAALFYVSALCSQVPTEAGVYLISNTHAGRQIALEDQARIIRFQELIGNRFFLFSGDLFTGDFLKIVPTEEEVKQAFKGRRLVYDPHTLELVGYGEYLDLCVTAWEGVLGKRLGLPESNTTFLPELSLNFVDDINIFGGLDNSVERPTIK